MALWAPAPDPRAALELAARARVACGAMAPAGDPASAPPVPPAPNGTGAPTAGAGFDGGPAPEAAPGGSSPAVADDDAPVDLFDTPLAAELAEGSAVRSLADELGRGPRPLLLAVTTAGGRETIVAGCRARGMAVDVLAHTYDDERDGLAVPGAPADALVDETARWLVAQLAPDERAGAAAPTAGPEAGCVTPTQNGRRVRVVHVIDSLAGSGGAENRLVDEVVALTPRFDQSVVRLFERDFFDAPWPPPASRSPPSGSAPRPRGAPGR